jgi:hypothetical protein
MSLAVALLLQGKIISRLTCSGTQERGPSPVMSLAAGMRLQRVASSRLTCALTQGRGPTPVMCLAVATLLHRVAIKAHMHSHRGEALCL